MPIAAGGLAGDPLALPVGQGRAAVHRGGHLQPHPGPAAFHPGEEADVELAAGLSLGAVGQLNLHAGGAQALDARAVDLGEGIGRSDHHPGDAGLDERVATRRRAAVVGTGFQRDPGRGTAGAGAARRRIAQRHDLGVRATSLLRGAFGEHLAVVQPDDAAHPRVGLRQPEAGLRQPSGLLQSFVIEGPEVPGKGFVGQLIGWWGHVLLSRGVKVSSSGQL